MGQPTLDLFESRLCPQLPRYIAWKPDPSRIVTDAFLHPWDREYGFGFLRFSLRSRFLRKILEEKIDHLIIVTPTWQMVCTTSKNVCAATISSASDKKYVNKSTGEKSSSSTLVETSSLRLAVWKVSGKVCKWKEFQAMLPSLSQIQGEKAQQLITNRPGVSGLAGVMKDKLILFRHL